jgi:two-component system, NarL family, response regulator NreC
VIRLLLVDDHAVVREGLSLLLSAQSNFVVVGEAASAAEAVERALATRPDVIVMDIGLQEDDGIPVIEVLRARVPASRVLVLSMYVDAETVRQALLAGAAGYVVKGAGAYDLVTGIRAVAAGHSFLHSSIADVVIDDGLRWLRGSSPLSRRERQVLSLLAGGHSAQLIGRSLGISTHTVRRHLANMAEKLEIHGIRALSQYALQQGMARPAATTPSGRPPDKP